MSPSFGRPDVRVSILIPLLNQVGFTRRCVETLIANTPGDHWEVILFDNGSTDGTAHYLTTIADPRFRWLHSPVNLGFGPANNAAAAEAQGEYLLCLNNDTEPQPGWLEPLLQVADADPKVGIVGSKLVFADGFLQEAGGIVYSNGVTRNFGRHGDPKDPAANYVREVDYASAAAALVRKSVFEALGGFDPLYAPAYFEDTDLCFGVRKLGYKVIYQPASVVVHFEGASSNASGENTASQRLIALNKPKFEAKWRHELAKQPAFDGALPRRTRDRAPGKRVLVLCDRPTTSDEATSIIAAVREGHAVTVIAARPFPDALVAHLTQGGVEVYPTDPAQIYLIDRFTPGPKPLSTLLAETKYEIVFVPTSLEQLHAALRGSPLTVIVNNTGTTNYGELIDVHHQLLDGAVHIAANSLPSAELVFRSLIQRHPSRAEGYAALGALLARSFRWHEAIEPLLAATGRAPQEGSYWQQLGIAQFEVGDLEAAKSSLETAVSLLSPPNAAQQYLARLRPKPDLAVTFVIVTEGSLAHLSRCFVCLATHPPSVEFELIVIDDSSDLHTQEFLRALGGDVRIVRNEQAKGRSDGLRQAATLSATDKLILLSPDVEFIPGWFEPLWRTLNADPQVGAVQPLAISPDGGIAHFGGEITHNGVPRTSGIGHPLPRAWDTTTRPDFVGTHCLLIRKSLWNSLGGLDSRYPPGAAQDADFTLRIQEAGCTVALQQASSVVLHLTTPTEDQRGDGRKGFIERWGDHLQRRPQRRRPQIIALFLPQFHPIPENNGWWGPGFTEWNNVARSRPLFEGHEQPHVPGELGYYDLRLQETRQAQAKLAKEHGIDAFCYYHYWSGGRRLLERPVDDLLASPALDFPFCLCWANEDWRANWDGRSGTVLSEQVYSPADDREHIQWLLRAFQDPRYARVEGKPIFLVYRAKSLPDPKTTIALWRAEAMKVGLELFLCRVESFSDEQGDPAALGFDASIEFQPDWRNLGTPLPGFAPHRVYSHPDVVRRMLEKPEVSWRRIPCVNPRWDNSARRPQEATLFTESSPTLYKNALATVSQREVKRNPDSPMVFVNAWNEWAEGAMLEPCAKWGKQYLEAHYEGLGYATAPKWSWSRRAEAANRQHLDKLIDQGEALVDAAPERAAFEAQIAAHWAWARPSGRWSDPRLERLLIRLAANLPSPAIGASPRPKHLLHVLTRGDGPAFLLDTLLGWIRGLPDHHHSIVVTQGEPAPALVQAASQSGGTIHRLTPATLWDNAVELRTLSAAFPHCILHSHPYDVVPVLALAHRSSQTQTTYVEHFERGFWLGVGVADRIVHHRTPELAPRRRISARRSTFIPNPLLVPRPVDRTTVRRAVGVDENDFVVATAVQGNDGHALDGWGLFDLIETILSSKPTWHWWIAGAVEPAAWDALQAKLQGRIRRVDVDQVWCADVFVDSYPLPHPTAAWNAGLHSLPSLRYDPDRSPEDTRNPSIPTFSSWVRLQTRLEELAASLADRRTQGQKWRDIVLNAHTGASWTSAAAAAFEPIEPAAALPLSSEFREFDADSHHTLLAHMVEHADEDTIRRHHQAWAPRPKKPKFVAFYLPQFHPIPENDAWWGEGFTEWTNVRKSKPLYPGHDQPRVPTELGYYDLRDPGAREAQAALAQAHGIDAFCYWHYWFNGKRLLERPFNEVLHSGKPDLPFCLAWANEPWSRTWLGLQRDVLQPQSYSTEDDEAHARWLMGAFADPRHLRIQGRPLFAVYHPSHHPEPERFTRIVRQIATAQGLPNPYLVAINGHSMQDFRKYGFDANLKFEPQLGVLPEGLNDDFPETARKEHNRRTFGFEDCSMRLYSDADARKRMLENPAPPAIPCVYVGWDNSPRRAERSIMVVGTTPENFEDALSKAVERHRGFGPEHEVVFINAWNEWAEGNYLEPDQTRGTSYLDAVKRVKQQVQGRS